MKNPLGVSPSKGYQGTARGKEKNSYDLVAWQRAKGQLKRNQSPKQESNLQPP